MDETITSEVALSVEPVTNADVANAVSLALLRRQIDGIDPEKASNEAAKFVTDPNCAAFLIRDNSTPQGYLEMLTNENLPVKVWQDLSDYAHLSRIGVTSESRGRGFAKRLMQQAETWAKGKGKTGIWLEYKDSNTPAKSLYEKSGYTPVGKFKDEKGVNRTIVAKKLN